MPQYKVPLNNLLKLNFEKKIVNIVLDMRLMDPDHPNSGFLLLRDRFDWDLSEPYMRPTDFANQLVDQLGMHNS